MKKYAAFLVMFMVMLVSGLLIGSMSTVTTSFMIVASGSLAVLSVFCISMLAVNAILEWIFFQGMIFWVAVGLWGGFLFHHLRYVP